MVSITEVIMSTTLSKQIFSISNTISRRNFLAISEKISELFWFSLSLLLFIVLGPFAAPVVLLVLVRLGMEENDAPEPESIT